MNLYLLKIAQHAAHKFEYEYFDAAVVAAKDEFDALSIHPSGRDASPFPGQWPTMRSMIDVGLIGVAYPGIERGVVLASFNAA